MSGRIKQAFDLRANARDVFVRPESRMPLIDGVRALSIIYVLVFHSLVVLLVVFGGDNHTDLFRELLQQTPWYWQWAAMGDRGVDVFFVISGFLIGQMLFREYESNGRINLKRFFMRRLLRLTPVYWFVIVLFAVLAGPAVIDGLVQEDGLAYKDALWVFGASMAAYAAYLSNFLPYEQSYYIPFAWSLAVEEQFYILFSLFMAYAYAGINRRLAFLLGVFAASFLVRAFLFGLYPHLLVNGDELLAGAGGASSVTSIYREVIYDNLYTRFGAIVLGIVLAWLFVYRHRELERWMSPLRNGLLLVLALVLIVLMSVMPVFSEQDKPQWMVFLFHVSHRNLFSLGVVLLIAVALVPHGPGQAVQRFLSCRLFFPVAQLSYSMYLVHLPLLAMTATALKAVGATLGLGYAQTLLLMALSLPATFLLSLMMFVLIERPFMKLRKS